MNERVKEIAGVRTTDPSNGYSEVKIREADAMLTIEVDGRSARLNPAQARHIARLLTRLARKVEAATETAQ